MIMDKSFLEIIQDNTSKSADKNRLIENELINKYAGKYLLIIKKKIVKASLNDEYTIIYCGPKFFRKNWTYKVMKKIDLLLKEEGFNVIINSPLSGEKSIEISWKNHINLIKKNKCQLIEIPKILWINLLLNL